MQNYTLTVVLHGCDIWSHV